MRKHIIIFMIMLIFLTSINAEAFWWLFGKSVDEVQLTYLYINKLSYDQSEDNITLFRDYLEDGLITIRGRAVINKGQIGSVMVSLDGKETWNSAEISDDGAFQYSFKPETGRTYEMYIEVMETAGRTNDVDQTYKAVTVSELSYEDVINNRLAEIFAAYMERDTYQFMNFVSWDFVGGDLVLEQALNKDFSSFADIDIEYDIINLSLNAEGMIAAVLEFDRRVISIQEGKTLTDSGITEFVFKLEEDGPVLYSMSHPLIFGISDAARVGSGLINSAENDQVIAVDEEGNINLKPVEEIASDTINDGIDDESDDGSDNDSDDNETEPDYVYGERNLSHIQTGYEPNYSENYQAYRFSDDTVLDQDWDDIENPYDGPIDLFVAFAPDTAGGGYELAVDPAVGYIRLNETNINNVDEVPAAGYNYESDPFSLGYSMEAGRCYALKLRDGNYAIAYYERFEILEADTDTGKFHERTTLYFKYRDDGGRQF